jgi:hypothetical protein
VADPAVVLDRLRTLLWGYEGGVGRDVAFIAATPFLFGTDFAEVLRGWYRQVAYLARYLRQPIPWILEQTLEDVRGYQDALTELVRSENGTQDGAGAGATPGGVRVPMRSPFGDYDGGG